MRLVRLISTTVLLAATTMLFAEDVTLEADFAPGSPTDVSTVGTDFTVRLTLARPDGAANPGLTAYDVRMEFDPAVFEVTGYTPLVAYLPAEYVVAMPTPGIDPPNMDAGMGYFHFTGADLPGTSTPANGEVEQGLFEVNLKTVSTPSFPLPIEFMQNNRPNRDQGPVLAFGAGALTLPDTVTYDHSAFGGPIATPTPTPIPTPSPTPVPADNDEDRDGLTDTYEDNTSLTDKTEKDSDSDDWEDGVEVAIGTDPNDPNDPGDVPDSDNDGVPDANDPDPNDPDADGDGVMDFWEMATGFDPNDPNDVPPIGDANEDGSKDFTDAVAMFNLFLGNFNPDNYADYQYLDVNRDGRLDSVDGVLMFNWYLDNLPYLPFVP